MKTSSRFLTLLLLSLLPLTASGCATMNWETLADGLAAALDDVLDEAAASEGTTTLREASSRAWERRVDTALAAQDSILMELAEESSSAATCPHHAYEDYLLFVAEGWAQRQVLEAELGGRSFGASLLARFDRGYADHLRTCDSMTDRLLRGEVPFLHEDDRATRIMGFALSRSDEWQTFQRELLPPIRQWAMQIHR